MNLAAAIAKPRPFWYKFQQLRKARNDRSAQEDLVE